MRFTRLLAAVMAAPLVCAGIFALSAPANAAVTSADKAIKLPVSEFGGMVLDSTDGLIFVLGKEGTVSVSYFGGASAGVITGLPYAMSMALDASHQRLYVSLSTTPAVAVIDTTTLKEVARYPFPSAVCPQQLAYAASKVWFLDDCSQGANLANGANYYNHADLGSLDPSTTPPTIRIGLAPQPPTNGVIYLQTFPTRPNDLLMTSDYNDAVLADMSVTPPTTVTSSALHSSLEVATAPDGAHFWVPDNLSLSEWSLSDLTKTAIDGPVPSSDWTYGADSVAASSSGYVAGVASTGNTATALKIWGPDGSIVRTYPVTYGSQFHYFAARGLAFSDDGSRLYAITADNSNGQNDVQLDIFYDPTKTASTLTLSTSGPMRISQAQTISGTLSSTAAIPAGQTLTVTRTGPTSTVALPSVTTGANGTFSFTDTVANRQTFTYAVTWAGDTTHHWATASLPITFMGDSTSISISTDKNIYRYGSTVKVSVHLGTAQSRTISIYAQQYKKAKTLLVTHSVDSNGNYSVSYKPQYRTDFTVSFGGDAIYEPASALHRVSIGVLINQKFVDNYGTSGSIGLYHVKDTPRVQVRVDPGGSGDCMSWEVQLSQNGNWTPEASNSCLRLDGTRHADVVFVGKHSAGTYRIRATFTGATELAHTTGAWLTFRMS